MINKAVEFCEKHSACFKIKYEICTHEYTLNEAINKSLEMAYFEYPIRGDA